MSTDSPRNSARWAALGALVVVVWLQGEASLRAQTTSAAVFGSVNDTQGGMLAGATVTLTMLVSSLVIVPVAEAGVPTV